ncbi:MAG TPA: hypothetical protein VGG28_02780, partial [Kofleriaceae bacterium]
LWIRHACYRAFFSEHRPTLERLLPRTQSLLQMGVNDFAGVPMSPLTLARGAGQLLRALVRESASR